MVKRSPTNNRKFETLIYAGIWLLAVVLSLLDIMRRRSYTDSPLLDLNTVGLVILNLLPFMALFAINNYLLIPRLLKQNRYGTYFIATVLLVIAVWLWQHFQLFEFLDRGNIAHPEPPHDGLQPQGLPHKEFPRPKPDSLLPLPLFLSIIYDFLIIGVNLATSLVFQHVDDRIERERLMKENARNQLTYLKTQISPHFYMNMLNNIHGMVELNPAKAQEMIIEMASLMRYMLYESSCQKIGLSSEVLFIRNYLGLMRERYPEDAVSISAKLPGESETAGISVPPLLFLTFIENAFKHGVSYTDGGSFISVNLSVDQSKITFLCMNSVVKSDRKSRHEGIGLDNVKRRLDIIYGADYNLDIESNDTVYSVNLTLPYEIENTDN